jgi:hypothetical protein
MQVSWCSVSLARIQCVSHAWLHAASSDHLWRRHARIELNASQLSGHASFKNLFYKSQVRTHACMRSPWHDPHMHACMPCMLNPHARMQADGALAPLKCEARFASALAALTHWQVRLQQWSHPLPSPVASLARTPGWYRRDSTPHQLQQPNVGPSGTSPQHHHPQQQHDPQLLHSVTLQGVVHRNRQSLWAKYELPAWVQGPEEEDEEEQPLLGPESSRPWNVSLLHAHF